jgi:hypothetical protein
MLCGSYRVELEKECKANDIFHDLSSRVLGENFKDIDERVAKLKESI